MTVLLQSLDQALERVKNLCNSDKRIIIGITGKPGAGKSTVTSYFLDNLPRNAISVVPMDGFHLSTRQLERLKLSDKKGAFYTFDVDGFVNLLQRINSSTDKDIYFPIFHRNTKESFAGDGVVHANTKLVITEGNYLLFDQGGWERVQVELSEVWYIKVNDQLRLERLTKRHQVFGKDEKAAYDWAHGTDEANAEIVQATLSRADVILEL